MSTRRRSVLESVAGTSLVKDLSPFTQSFSARVEVAIGVRKGKTGLEVGEVGAQEVVLVSGCKILNEGLAKGLGF